MEAPFYCQVYKVETVGDCYMTVAGVPEHIAEHAEVLCHTALGIACLFVADELSS